VSQSGQTEVGSQGFVVCQLFHLSALKFSLIKNADMNRPISSSHLSRVYSGGSYDRPIARLRAKPARPLSLQKTGDHSISTPRSLSPPFSSCYPHGCPGGQPQDSAHSTTRYASFKTPSHTSHNRSPCKLARPFWAMQASKFSSRPFL
jgi:hypothetical protein